MDLRARFRRAIAAGCIAAGASALCLAQEPTPTAPAAVAAPAAAQSAIPASGGAAPLRLSDPPSIRVERLPPENPFGLAVEMSAALPPKPSFVEQVVEAPLYAAVQVDRTGKPTGLRRARDPIPSLSADERKSFDRWLFEPARKGGQPVPTWASFRLDLHVELKAPKIEQITLTPVTPSTSIPAPLEWGPDQAWYDSLRSVPPSDGTVAIEQVDTLAVPKKTKWDADSYRGPFSVRMWVKISAAGRADRTIPIQASDPILIADVRKQIATWQFRPARVNGQSADSWNELSLSGSVAYSVEVKQIANLRKTLPDAAEPRR